jgi:tRNA A37 threonylcarbamoyladenosine dehydratase
MLNEFSRTELLIGKQAIEKLRNSKVAVFGIGGVGTFAVEGLVRAGIGNLTLIDDDCICITNINRQLHATFKTIGKPKVEAMKDRILEINPKAKVECFQRFYMPGDSDDLVRKDYDYIIDAIDTVTAKIDLVVSAKKAGIPIISCMGVGNKLSPFMLEMSDIYKTSVCPLAKVVRKELKKREIESLKVLYSKELPIKPINSEESSCSVGCVCPKGSTRRCTVKHQIPGSISYMPSIAGLMISGEVIKDLIGK